ncbi:MAG: tRNA (adenosine(37)-N6)-threonylcarbamoyltransferase complex dimerization subunit type 1 TsaB [Sphingobium phenoxybenzoativorans]
MRTLVIDTATQALSIALFDNGDLIAHHHEIAGRGHAEKLMPAIAALPDGGRANRVAVDVGPGSFTGVRIGIAAARALAFAWQAELAGYSAMTLVAAAARQDGAKQWPVAVAITGGHGELFWQMFDRELSPGGDLESVPIAALAARVSAEVIYGSGAEALCAARGTGLAVPLHPDSRLFPDVPEHGLIPPHPLYGRGADAKPMATPAGAV